MNTKDSLVGSLVRIGDQIVGVLTAWSANREVIDTTCMGDAWRQYSPGNTTYDLKVQGSGPAAVKVVTGLKGQIMIPASMLQAGEKYTLTEGRLVSYKKGAKMKIRNRFYIGHPGLLSPYEQSQDNDGNYPTSKGAGRWSHKTLVDAIKHAEAMIDADRNKDEVFIVKIVKRVIRKKAPVIVENV